MSSAWVSPSITAIDWASRSVTSMRFSTSASWVGAEGSSDSATRISWLSATSSKVHVGGPSPVSDRMNSTRVPMSASDSCEPHGGMTVPGFPLAMTSR